MSAGQPAVAGPAATGPAAGGRPVHLPGRPVTPDRARARRVIRTALAGHRRDLAWLAAWSAGESLPALVLGRCVAGAIDAFRAGASLAGLAWLAVLGAAAVAGALASRQAYRRLGAIVEPLRDRLITMVVTAALHRSPGAGRDPDTGVLARITHQAEIVRDSFAGLMTTVRTSAFAAGAALLGLASLAPAVALVSAGPLLGSLGLFAWLMRSLARRQYTYVVTEEAVAGAVSAAAGSLRDITACGGEGPVAAGTGAEVGAQARAGRALAGLTACRTLVLAAGCWLPVLLVIGGAPWLLRHGVTAGGVIGALAYLAGGLQVALGTLVQGTGSSGVRMTVTLARMLAGTGGDGPPPARARAHPSPARRPPADGGLRVRGLTFAYGLHAEPVIRDLCLDVPAGDHLAVVGPSGIGKSTLAGLLTGMLRPARGEVLLGGVPVGGLTPAELARHRVLIPQEAYVFTGTVRENLAYFRPGASPSELAAAAAATGAAALIERAGGYGAPLDPAALSDGERQLIALTRAYLSPAALIVLDEAASQLAPAAEARAEQAFASRPGTLIVIAHRASSALRARRVLVLDGTSAQVGEHSWLLAQSGLYADLIGHWDSTGGQGAPAGAAREPA